MKVENVDVLVSRLGDLVTDSKEAISFLNKFKNAEDILATLSADQKTAAMVTVSALAVKVAGAYQLATEAFTAEETL